MVTAEKHRRHAKSVKKLWNLVLRVKYISICYKYNGVPVVDMYETFITADAVNTVE